MYCWSSHIFFQYHSGLPWTLYSGDHYSITVDLPLFLKQVPKRQFCHTSCVSDQRNSCFELEFQKMLWLFFSALMIFNIMKNLILWLGWDLFLDIHVKRVVCLWITTDSNLARKQRSKIRWECYIRVIMKLNQIPFDSSYSF